MEKERLLRKPTEQGIELTPLEIHMHEFDHRLRGYDQDQVNDYLDRIIKDYETYNKIIKELQEYVVMLLNHATPSSVPAGLHQRLRELEIHCFGRPKD
ncbi:MULTISPECIES: DivIVA domain-containing protein [Paenibacillus]|uniref:DivIVA domain protein n=3 Tax=Paenibacillus TaxID=44249 RepID=G4HJY0_9BACL|nr:MULTISPECIES: DivIVA domain-containing protein [Paenibacillus]ANY76292.1 cell division protein DivIVA [Paenibacillus ihbetae]EHB62584.1 DivIVA domain protein [Paenibacillus lactis 154]MBP1896837.1 DivIVA domain-containing protein [Paenibacillus lactis]OOC61565.1 cell division protein DivIVA [Paenibacillus ihbetae]GIO90382.1 hypothetical protein J31TS3_16090 [Paenibacillus lactis]